MAAFLENVDYLVNELKENDTTINEVNIAYRHNNNSRPYQLFSGEGRVNVQTDEDYFENVREHLEFAYYQVIEPVINKVSQPFDLPLHFVDTGEVELDNLDFTFTFQVTPKQNESEEFFKMINKTLTTIGCFNSQITEVVVRGNRHLMNQIQFRVQTDRTTVLRNLHKPTSQQSIDDTWFSLFDTIYRHYEKHHTYTVRTPIVQGKPKFEQRTHQFVRRVMV